MTLLQLEVFIKVVETGSFTRAAEALNLTQSGVSHTIAGLEQDLGLSLLMRSRNGISLTDTGERLMSHIREILNHVEHMKQEVAALNGLKTGKVKIGCFPSVSANLLPKLIRSFRSKYPEIEVEIQEGGYDSIHSWLTVGAVDLGFVVLPYKEFETTSLVTDHLVALVPMDHHLAEEPELSAAQLCSDPFIMPKAGCDMQVKDFFRSSEVIPNTQFEVLDNNTIIAMVREKLGITIIPEMSLSKPLTELCVIPLTPSVQRPIGLAVRSFKNASPAVKTFIQMAKTKSSNS